MVMVIECFFFMVNSWLTREWLTNGHGYMANSPIVVNNGSLMPMIIYIYIVMANIVLI